MVVADWALEVNTLRIRVSPHAGVEGLTVMIWCSCVEHGLCCRRVMRDETLYEALAALVEER